MTRIRTTQTSDAGRQLDRADLQTAARTRRPALLALVLGILGGLLSGCIEDPSEPPVDPVQEMSIVLSNITNDPEAMNWVRIEVDGDSAGDSSYDFGIRSLDDGRLIHGPGTSSTPIAQVLLSPGAYLVTVSRVTGPSGPQTQSAEIVVLGEAIEGGHSARTEWAMALDWEPGDQTISIQHPAGPAAFQDLFGHFRGGSLGSVTPAASCAAGGNGWGITGAITAGLSFSPTAGMAMGRAKGLATKGAGGGYVKAAIGMSTTLAAVNASSAGIAAAGGTSGCFQDTLDAINDEFAHQQAEIDEIFETIARDEEVFFRQMTQVNGLSQEAAALAYQNTRAELGALFKELQEASGMWDTAGFPYTDPSDSSIPIKTILGPTWQPMIGDVWADDNDDGVGDNIDPLDPSYQTYSLVGCPYSIAACCLTQYRELLGGDCVEDSGGLMAGIADVDLTFLEVYLKDLSGSEYQDPGGNLKYNAYKNISSHSGDDFIFSQYDLVLQYYKLKLENGTKACLSEDAGARSWCPNASTNQYAEAGHDPLDDNAGDCLDDPEHCTASDVTVQDNNVVPLYETYNNVVVALTMQSMFALDQAYHMERLINQINYESHMAQTGGSITHSSALPGTHYTPSEATLCAWDGGFSLIEGFVDTDEEHTTAYNCAQVQLAFAYGKRVNLLYTHVLNYTATDRATEGQGYPSTTFHNPESELDPQSDYPHQIDYEEELGAALLEVFNGGRSPSEGLAKQFGTQTGLTEESIWTNRGVIYQAGLPDIATCRRNLKAWLESGTSTTLKDFLLADPANCPSVFQQHDYQPLAGGFYDGQSLLAYHRDVSPGDWATCPDECFTCASGAPPDDESEFDTWDAGGEGLYLGTRNVAPQGVAEQSSTDYGGVAWLAIDGNTNGDWTVGNSNGTHTATGDPTPTWSLTWSAANAPVVDSIRIWNRTDCCDWRLAYFRVTLFDLNEDPLPGFPKEYFTGGTHAERSFDIDVNLPDRVGSLEIARMTQEDSKGERYLTLAEVEVFAPAGGDELCRNYCSADGKCGDFRYAVNEDGDWNTGAVDCRRCEGDDLLALSAPAPFNVSKCAAEERAWEPTWCAYEGEECTCDGEATIWYGKRYLNSLTDKTAPGSGTELGFLEMTSARDYPANPQWYADYFDTGYSSFLNALDSAAPKVFTQARNLGDTEPFDCSNTGFEDQVTKENGDPAPGFFKQCFCAPRRGNQLTVYTTRDDAVFDPETKTGSAPSLAVLGCGNSKVLTDEGGVGVGAYYEDNYSNQAKPPPGEFGESVYYTVSSACNGAFAAGMSYLTMTDPRCSRSYDLNLESVGKDDVLVAGFFGTIICDERDPNGSQAFGGEDCFQYEDQYWETLSGFTTDRPSFRGCNSVQFSEVRDGEDDEYGLTRFQIDPGNAATGTADGGPIIPLEVVYQCSDGEAGECGGGGSQACMHLVAKENSATAQKDGYMCTANQAEERLDCVLGDGRQLRVSLKPNGDQDSGDAERWMKLVISKPSNSYEAEGSWVSRCAESDFDFCPCAGDVVYGKKYLNSIGTAAVGDGTIARFEEMMEDANRLSWPAALVDANGFGVTCAPESFGNNDPAPGVYKQCFCVDPI